MVTDTPTPNHAHTADLQHLGHAIGPNPAYGGNVIKFATPRVGSCTKIVLLVRCGLGTRAPQDATAVTLIVTPTDTSIDTTIIQIPFGQPKPFLETTRSSHQQGHRLRVSLQVTSLVEIYIRRLHRGCCGGRNYLAASQIKI